MKSISTAHRNQIESARQNLRRQEEIDRQRNETLLAKQIQQETGCSWSEAIRAVIGKATGENE